MKKQEMIELLRSKFCIWCQVRDFMVGVEKINGWYTYYEGEQPGEFSFCSKNPRGDDTGEHITSSDFYGNKRN